MAYDGSLKNYNYMVKYCNDYCLSYGDFMPSRIMDVIALFYKLGVLK